MVKGRNVDHRCGACHRASDAQIRMSRTILEYNVTCRLEFFCTFLGVRSLYIYLLPFPSRVGEGGGGGGVIDGSLNVAGCNAFLRC